MSFNPYSDFAYMADETTTSLEHEAVVTYPVRELLSHIRTEQTQGFARLEASLNTKADKADMARMEMRLDQHARRIEDIETWRHTEQVAESVHDSHDERSTTVRRRVVAAIGTVLLILATALSGYIGTHLH